jgi:hypothetical protein
MLTWCAVEIERESANDSADSAICELHGPGVAITLTVGLQGPSGS